MSLPKRDGVHDRYYLIHKPDTSPEVLAEADLCIQDVLNGTAHENHSAYPTVVRNHNGTPFLPDQLLERYLTGLPLKGFPSGSSLWESGMMALPSFHPAQYCRNCERRMWTKVCCALPAMWRSAIPCTGRVLNPSPPNTSSAWVPRFVLTW